MTVTALCHWPHKQIPWKFAFLFMKIMLFLILILFPMNTFMNPAPLVFDFGPEKDFGRWSIINDGVMGGLSQSQERMDGDAVLFSGTVSLKNNGGFVSLRSAMGNYDLSGYTHCEIRFKSDTDRKFELLIEKETRFNLPKFRAKFGGKTQNWETLIIPLEDLEISRMGNILQQGIDPQALKEIQRIGIILADKQEGSFQLWIDYLKFY
ncbi:Complex I intermediate-associated protein 30 (CIA30) [Cecembia lonarensis LW9]|uniref:Complex I intermediate-associated protein 30 (CIA30) n=2 Tax=Cecembia TaxID=1187078 RepID=K1L0G0_CECL9|nr:Complex I intermediate-associated protein 30 (CIA30) [Cecembia lonarensis LW9]